MSKRKVVLTLFLGVITSIFVVLAIVISLQHVRAKRAILPSSPEFYADFIDEYNYGTLGFQYSENETIPVCFLTDIYDYVHQNYVPQLLAWRIISQSRSTVEYVFGFYDDSFLRGRFSPKNRHLMKFITSYETSVDCEKGVDDLNVLFPSVTVP